MQSVLLGTSHWNLSKQKTNQYLFLAALAALYLTSNFLVYNLQLPCVQPPTSLQMVILVEIVKMVEMVIMVVMAMVIRLSMLIIVTKTRVWVDSQAARCGGQPHKRDSVAGSRSAGLELCCYYCCPVTSELPW